MKKQIISVLSMLAGAAAGAGTVGKMSGEKLDKARKMSDKHLALFLMVKQKNKNLASYLGEKGYRKIAIYGMSYAGETLAEELADTEVEIRYGIDQKCESIYANFNIVSVEDELEEVDAVIVTAVTFFDDILEKLSQKLDCPVISLEDILYEI